MDERPKLVTHSGSCLDGSTIDSVAIEDFDGQNWEQHAHELEHLSADDV
jgi:hypothetical protein